VIKPPKNTAQFTRLPTAPDMLLGYRGRSKGVKDKRMAMKMFIIFNGKAKDINIKEIWLTLRYGRILETLEPEDFSKN